MEKNTELVSEESEMEVCIHVFFFFLSFLFKMRLVIILISARVGWSRMMKECRLPSSSKLFSGRQKIHLHNLRSKEIENRMR